MDGVFLIHHRKGAHHVRSAARHVREIFPELWVGINCLDLPVERVVTSAPLCINGIWYDDGGIEENEFGFGTYGRALKFYEANKPIVPHLEFFGGFAFKYQKPVIRLAEGAKLASDVMDVVTTSGEGTGIAADVEKMKIIRENVTKRVGIASGITPENVRDYLPYVDDFLVATGISWDEYNFDADKIARLLDTIKSYG